MHLGPLCVLKLVNLEFTCVHQVAFLAESKHPDKDSTIWNEDSQITTPFVSAILTFPPAFPIRVLPQLSRRS